MKRNAKSHKIAILYGTNNDPNNVEILKKIKETVRIVDISQDTSWVPTECKAAVEAITL
jgi:hypothetical protein